MAQDEVTPNRQAQDTSYTVIDPGPYIGIVKWNEDDAKMGTLQVVIPSLNKSNEAKSGNLYTVKYMPQFYGVKSHKAVDTTNPGNFNSTQHSYGMWFVPPDIDTSVMVLFVEGKTSAGYWIGCIPEPYINHMVPGIASSPDSMVKADAMGMSTTTTADIYGTDNVPVGEVNRAKFESSSQQGYDKLKKPIHPFADTLQRQGLIRDVERGTTSSSARRESPSQVFGISTPGRVKESTTKTALGPTDTLQQKSTVRDAGHSFVLDDGDTNGKNQLIRLRTATGHQLVMNDSAGVVYLANSDGSVWMEFSKGGMVDIYAQMGYNVRSGGNINFHAEGDINMFANNSIKIKANKEVGRLSLDADVIRGIGRSAVQLDSDEGILTLRSKNSIYTQAVNGSQIHQAGARIDLVGSQVHFNSIGKQAELVPGLERTSFSKPTGTGTGPAEYPDVTPRLGEILQTDRALPGMTGMRVPTHEPFWGHPDRTPLFASSGDKSTSPGTLGFIENSNRNSDLFTVRYAQMVADYEAELKKNPELSAKIFTQGWDKSYKLFSGSSKFNDYKQLADGVKDLYSKLTSLPDLTNINIPTPKVLVNEAGVLFTENLDKVVTVAKKSTSQTIGKVIDTAATVGSIIINAGKIGVPDSGNNFIGSISTITETHKNVIGGQVTLVTQITSAINSAKTYLGSVVKSIGKLF